ncbi:hypothetical protein BN14_12174 [Rhizoctonia solani AG-1 IB]|uniref:Uncharacterized protein n=1 Tax=Thanatephorus cucumeris (strain AG1-IB / isolate 7/3/14) TaxID=1108050 RepID=M5CDH3_THACB|nr:hypothetical protein BN14_12174 [Rhizoctonia solani AG-1 IB]
MAEQPESDTSDAEDDTPTLQPTRPGALSDESGGETDGEGAVGLVGDTTMKTAAGSDKDSGLDDEGKEGKEDEEDEEGEEGEEDCD